MITRPTVFVLGAGASGDSGLPTGLQLRQYILEATDPRRSTPPLRDILSRNGLTELHIEEFRKAFADSHLASIDLFLERRPEFKEMGKIAIAFLVSLFESTSNCSMERAPDGGFGPVRIAKGGYQWLHHLWQRLIEASDIGENQLTIITFNYDRLIEQFLWTSLRASTPPAISDDRLAARLREIEVLHLHGSLGELPWQGGTFDYGIRQQVASYYKGMADNIKIISEAKPNDQTWEWARLALSSAEVIAFMGCAYHRHNISRLSLSDGNLQQDVQIYGTALGLGEAEIGAAQKLIGRVPKLVPMDCLQFLKEMPVLV